MAFTEDFFRMMFDPMAMMGKGIEVGLKYNKFLVAQTKLFRALADYNEAAAELHRASTNIKGDGEIEEDTG